MGGGDSTPGGLGCGVQAPVPHGDDQAWFTDGQRTCQMHCVGTAQGMGSGEAAGVPFDRCAEFDRAGGGPEVLPVMLGRGELRFGEVVVAGCCGERGTDFWVGQTAGQGGVAAVP